MFHCTGLFLNSSRSTWYRTTLLLGSPAQEGGTMRLPWACKSIPGWVKAPSRCEISRYAKSNLYIPLTRLTCTHIGRNATLLRPLAFAIICRTLRLAHPSIKCRLEGFGGCRRLDSSYHVHDVGGRTGRTIEMVWLFE
jgi:hypothetical protein